MGCVVSTHGLYKYATTGSWIIGVAETIRHRSWLVWQEHPAHWGNLWAANKPNRSLREFSLGLDVALSAGTGNILGFLQEG